MRWLRIILIALVAGLLQVSILGAIRLGNVVPNLVVVMVVCMTVWRSASEALLAAVIAGLIMDIAGGDTFGLATSALVLIGLALVVVRQLGVDGEIVPIRIALVIAASVAWSLIHVSAIGLTTLALVATWRVIGIELMLSCALLAGCTERIFRGSRTI